MWLRFDLIFLRSFKSLWVRPRSCPTILQYGSYTCEYFKISQHHSREGWYFFPLKVRKEGLLEDDVIVNAKKKEVWKWVSQNGCVAKMA